MCSPSRATLLTGRYPAQHGVTLTHTQADLRPDLAQHAGGARRARRDAAGTERAAEAGAPQLRPRAWSRLGRSRAASRSFAPTPRASPPAARARLRGRLQGQVAPHPSLGRRGSARRLDATPTPSASATTTASPTGSRPTPARTPRPSTSAPATPGPLGQGWDEVYTRQVEDWLGRQDLPEPFCLVVSLVNPHDVLGYPAQHVRGGYTERGFRDLGVTLPPTLDEDLRDKPSVHELMKMGMAAYLGPLRQRGGEARLRQLLRPPAPRGRRADRPGASARSATPPTRRRCARGR